MQTAPVSANIVTKNPDMSHLALTLRSLANQNRPPAEVIIVDSTPGGHAVESENGGSCSLCGGSVSKTIEDLQSQGVTVQLVHNTDVGIGGARDRATMEASQPAVWDLDEDAVIDNPEWTQRALDRLDTPGVAAVGGNVTPLGGTMEGRVYGAMDAAAGAVPGGWYIMYPRAYCTPDEKCYTLDQHRGEDRTTRAQLKEHGELVRDPNLVAQKALPTNRQKSARNVILGSVGGAVSGAIGSKVIDYLTKQAREVV